MNTPDPVPFGRRTLLGFSAAAALAALTGCTVDTGAPDAPSASGAAGLPFPTDGVTLPTGEVKFRWLDSGDLKALFLKPVITAFGEQHPNVKVTYDGAGWDQVNQVVPLGIRNGSAPDVFALPQNVPAQTAINEGWVQPLDQLIPNFAAWKAAFPATALIPGVHVFDGKVYSWPLNSTRRLDKMLISNTALVTAAGIDPATLTTWDAYRAAAKTLTGKGKPGTLLTGDHLHMVVRYLAHSAGWTGVASGLDMKTGQYAFASEPILQAIDYLKSLVADGSVVPGFLTLKDKDGRAQFAAGIAGTTFNGPWDIPVWKKQTPPFEYSLHRMPSPEGKEFTIPFAETGANLAWAYAKTPVPEVVGVIMGFLGSVAGQTKMVELTQGNLASLIPEAASKADASLLDPHARTAAELARTLMRAAPQLEIRTPLASKVNLALKAVQPGFDVIMQGIFSNQITNVKAALTELDSKLNAAMDAAFATAKSGGAAVDRSMLAFPNWDPTKDYTKADYDALG